jgi:serine/threonine protein kinase
LQGVDYLHGKRLVHFDLKSANLLVTMKDKVPCIKVADFGLTKQRRQTFVTGELQRAAEEGRRVAVHRTAHTWRQ